MSVAYILCSQTRPEIVHVSPGKFKQYAELLDTKHGCARVWEQAGLKPEIHCTLLVMTSHTDVKQHARINNS